MSYSTTIPRMVGLSGSSAIIIAAFRVLLKYFNLSLHDLQLTLTEVPQFILSIETKELGIAAGLQDRVIQTYGGLVHMDFTVNKVNHHDMSSESEKATSSSLCGQFTRLDASLLPPMYVVYNTAAGGESGRVHSTVKQRWLEGEEDTVKRMQRIAELADEAVCCLHNHDAIGLCALIDKNFSLRRQIYGDEVVGEKNIRVAELASAQLNLAAKFTGSGGAFLMMRRDGTGWFNDVAETAAKQLLSSYGFQLERVEVGESQQWPE
eukprot:CAMPEP_0182423652 /NCGR_PEP_ID=MMETSP1167-20130531/9728_1 /TAXON_ID=2988 /ORGANISM="Mallomonas Sp, Strain CCMP3275" /LENGTH=263 /DNA_ID=CAMNT_0024602833 /DNA_START=295 /DNA_END=1086 /DNA_ORIENTATION=+